MVRFRFDGDEVDRLVPRDLLEATFAARAHTLQWVQKTIGIVDAAAHRAALEAGAQLGMFEGVGRIVGRDAHDDAISSRALSARSVRRSCCCRARGRREFPPSAAGFQRVVVFSTRTWISSRAETLRHKAM